MAREFTLHLFVNCLVTGNVAYSGLLSVGGLLSEVFSLASSALLFGIGLLAVSWPSYWVRKTKWWETSKRGWVGEMRMTCSSSKFRLSLE